MSIMECGARTSPGRGLLHVLLARLLERPQVRPAGRSGAGARLRVPLARCRLAPRPKLVVDVNV